MDRVYSTLARDEKYMEHLHGKPKGKSEDLGIDGR
jgi:hypothetical protein